MRQEIDGKEALRITLPTSAQSVTVKLASLFTNDDGSAFNESGLLRLIGAAGQVVAEQIFVASAADGSKTITLSAAAGFQAMELVAGAYDNAGNFVYGGYSNALPPFADTAGKLHGSDFLLDALAFDVTLVGVPPG